MKRPGHITESTRQAWQASQGFTLVEVLVALALLGLMSVFLFGSFRFGARAWEAGSGQIEGLAEVEVVQNLLRNEISQATPLFIEVPASEPEAALAGSSSELRFAAPLPAHRGVGGYYIFWLSSSDPSERGDLTLRWRIYRPDMSIAQETSDETAILLHRVADLSFEYYGRLRDQTESDWHDSWNGQDGLPRLVRLRVEFLDGNRRRWPEFVVALKSLGEEASE